MEKSIEEIKKELKGYITDLPKIFERLKSLLNNTTDILLLEGRHDKLKKKSMLGLLSYDEETRENNRILHSVLEFIDAIQPSDLIGYVPAEAPKIEQHESSEIAINRSNAEATRSALNVSSSSQKKVIARTNHLMVIGIDEYAHGIPPLQNAVLDAKAFRDLVLEKYQFEEENTTCLFNQEAKKDNILNAFYKQAKNLTEKDNLVVYFSGHGELNTITDRGYWLPVDARAGSWGSYLSNNDIMDILKVMKVHHSFFIVDSCFSGALFQRSTKNPADEKQERDPSRWLLTAGKNEPVSDGSPGRHSPFANALLNYLRTNDKPSLWVSELCGLVLRGVEFNAQNQTPRGEPLHNVGHYGGQFVFYPKLS